MLSWEIWARNRRSAGNSEPSALLETGRHLAGEKGWHPETELQNALELTKIQRIDRKLVRVSWTLYKTRKPLKSARKADLWRIPPLKRHRWKEQDLC